MNFFERPTASGHFWPRCPTLFAGQDLQANGTWMGVTRSGRFAAVTNIREANDVPADAISRGGLCSDFLMGSMTIADYLQDLTTRQQHYAGFNLLLGELATGDDKPPTLYHFSNRQRHITALQPGLHGLSNGRLNEAWPKVEQGKYALKEVLNHSTEAEAIQAVLLDRHRRG